MIYGVLYPIAHRRTSLRVVATFAAAALAASRAVEQADARVSAAERNASWWRMACLTACLPAVMALAALSWTRAGGGHAADSVSDTPEAR